MAGLTGIITMPENELDNMSAESPTEGAAVALRELDCTLSNSCACRCGRHDLSSGNFFRMLAKHARAKLVSDYRPIANVRSLYKVFAHMFFA